MDFKKSDLIGNILIASLLSILIYAGFLAYKSIDWTVLKRLESQPLVLPTPQIATPSAQAATSSSASVVKK